MARDRTLRRAERKRKYRRRRLVKQTEMAQLLREARRFDNPFGVMKHANKYEGGVALIVLGGTSGANWEKLRDEVHPDVILGANGTCFKIDDLDYWVLAENMSYARTMARRGSEREQQFMRLLTHEHHAKWRMISHRTWHLLEDTTNCVSIRRLGIDARSSFSFREYGEGLLHGPMLKVTSALRRGVRFRVGSVGTQVLHLAGILGVKEIHTIGFDLCFKDDKHHHWYDYPTYQPDRFRTDLMFKTYNGVRTQEDWIEGMMFLSTLEKPMQDVGITWRDHSDGLLKAGGVFCTV